MALGLQFAITKPVTKQQIGALSLLSGAHIWVHMVERSNKILHVSVDVVFIGVNAGRRRTADMRKVSKKNWRFKKNTLHFFIFVLFVHMFVSMSLCMDIWRYYVHSVSRVWWLSYLFHCLSHSLQPSISEPGCAKALRSFTLTFVASLSLSFFLSLSLAHSLSLSQSPPCLKIEKRHKAGYCSVSLGCWLLSAPL